MGAMTFFTKDVLFATFTGLKLLNIVGAKILLPFLIHTRNTGSNV